MRFTAHTAGASLLVVGGVSQLLQLVFSNSVSLPAPLVVRLLIFCVPLAVTAIGTLLLGVATRGRGGATLILAACALLGSVIANAAELFVDSSAGRVVGLLGGAVFVVLILVAAVILLSDGSLDSSMRYALLVPATALLLTALTYVLPLPKTQWLNLLVPAGFLAAGIILLRRQHATTIV